MAGSKVSINHIKDLEQSNRNLGKVNDYLVTSLLETITYLYTNGMDEEQSNMVNRISQSLIDLGYVSKEKVESV